MAKMPHVELTVIPTAEFIRLQAYEVAWLATQAFRERADKLTDGKGYTGKHWVEALVLEAERLAGSNGPAPYVADLIEQARVRHDAVQRAGLEGKSDGP